MGSLRRHLINYGATLLLCAVATVQMLGVAQHPERPRWKGGGFGMYSELYRIRHFCRFAADAPAPFPQERYAAAVREFQNGGEEERIDRLFNSFQQRGVPIEQIVVGRKRLDHIDGAYQLRLIPSQTYPPPDEQSQ